MFVYKHLQETLLAADTTSQPMYPPAFCGTFCLYHCLKTTLQKKPLLTKLQANRQTQDAKKHGQPLASVSLDIARDICEML